MGQRIPIGIQANVYGSEILVRIYLHNPPINPDVISYVLFVIWAHIRWHTHGLVHCLIPIPTNFRVQTITQNLNKNLINVPVIVGQTPFNTVNESMPKRSTDCY